MTARENSEHTDRRSVLRATASLPLAGPVTAALGADPTGRALGTESVGGRPTERDPAQAADSVYPQGVASGDPTPSGVVCWTRISPDAYRSNASLVLHVTADSGFGRVGGIWTVETDRLPDRDYTVKVDLDGELDPGRGYHYQFVYDDTPGPIGRFRTLPAPDASPDSVRLGVVTCQDYRNGYYPAYHYLANEDVDFLVHLGDAIYEWAGPSDFAGRAIELPSGHDVVWGLADFRHLYRTYRADRFSREALARYAMIATWDDHEIVDNRYWDYEADRPAAGDGAHPRNDDAAFMTRLFADGIQAWWEYTPVRVRYDPDAEHLHDRLRLWRSFRFGDLATLLVTDQRLFRSAADGDPAVDLSANAIANPGEATLDHTMLGATQREWFADAVAGAETTWTCWANEVLNGHLDTTYAGRTLFSNAEFWDGYEAERRLLMRYLRERDVENFVAFSGDLHSSLAGYLQVDYDRRAPADERVGVELMTPALSSTNLAESSDFPDSPLARELASRAVVQRNPHLRFFDSFHHGYAVAELTPDACEFTVYAVDKSVDSTDADRRRLAAFRVPAGRAELERL